MVKAFMIDRNKNDIVDKVKECLIIAASTFSDDKKEVYRQAIERETVKTAKWVLETTLNNALVAEQNRSPLCDDTGIPHLFLEIGQNKKVDGELLSLINQGVAKGLRALPGRPMAIKGDDTQRIDQSGGLDFDPGALLSAPILLKPTEEDVLRLHILMHGGGPEIRVKHSEFFTNIRFRS